MVEIKNLYKSFKINGKVNQIISNLSFVLPSKGMYFILGKSGSGKSTLLNLMEGLIKPDKGSVKFNGKRIDNLSEEEKELFYKKEIGILFQSFNLFSDLSVNDNLNLATLIKDNYEEENIEKYLARFGLKDKVTQKVYTLSGGEKQRLALIRCLLNKPKIIFADEPTGALDDVSSHILMDELKRISEESLVVVVTHNRELVNKYADGYLEFINNKYDLNNIEKELKEVRNNILSKEKLKKSRTRFFLPFLKRNLLKNITKNTLTTLALIFSLVVSIFSFTFYFGIKDFTSSLIYTFPSYSVFEVYKSHSSSINGSSMAIEKKEKVPGGDIFDLLNEVEVKNFSIYENLDFFFKNNVIEVEGEKYENIIFEPSMDIYENEVLVNESFVNTYIKNYEKDMTFKFSSTNDYKYYDEIIEDEIDETFKLDLNFKIVDISNEFSFLETPKVYYSYSYLEQVLNLSIATNISNALGTDVSYYYLLMNAPFNDQLCSYSSLINISNEEEFIKFNNLINEGYDFGDIKFNNESKMIIDSFNEIINTLFIALIFFIVIITLTSIFIVFSLTYHSYISTKKERAILTILGSNKSSINLIYVLEEIVIYLISFIFSILVFNWIKNPILGIINSSLSFNLVINTSYLIIFVVFLFYFIVVLASSIIPLKVSKDIDIAEELKEE